MNQQWSLSSLGSDSADTKDLHRIKAMLGFHDVDDGG
jgi:hypothetical protein